jgi:bacteriocin-like protein
MDKKSLEFPTAQPVDCLIKQDLPTEMVELSDQDLQKIIGGGVLESESSSGCAGCKTPCSSSSLLSL